MIETIISLNYPAREPLENSSEVPGRLPLRVCVVGRSFAGKHTVGERLASEFGLRALKIDELIQEALHVDDEKSESEYEDVELQEEVTDDEAPPEEAPPAPEEPAEPRPEGEGEEQKVEEAAPEGEEGVSPPVEEAQPPPKRTKVVVRVERRKKINMYRRKLRELNGQISECLMEGRLVPDEVYVQLVHVFATQQQSLLGYDADSKIAREAHIAELQKQVTREEEIKVLLTKVRRTEELENLKKELKEL